MTAGDPRNRAVQRRQLLLFSGIAGVLAVAFVLWLGAGGGGDAGAPLPGIDAVLGSGGEAETAWVRQSETRLGTIESRLREIESRNRELEQDNLRLRERLTEDAEDARSVIDSQAATIEELTRTLEPGGTPSSAPGVSGRAVSQDPFAPAGAIGSPNASSKAQDEPAAPVATGPLMREYELENPMSSNTGIPGAVGTPEAAKPLSTYVPAGSYAEAVVLAGADASAGVSSQGDPRPVLLRLTSPAFGAAVAGSATRSDIEGCTVTGAAYGDLSSEKVYVRLQTLACAGEVPGTVIETTVSGFVAGSGQAGVRGPVVSREGALVQRAFLSGVFSGIGQGVNQAFRPQAVLAGGGSATFENTDLDSIGRAGLGAGAGTAGEQVSDYLIRRAEQYQPVIQLQAGTDVTVVFLQGAWLDGRQDNVSENG